MISIKGIIRLSILLAIVSWAGFLVTDLSLLFSQINDVNPGFHVKIPSLFYDLFILFLFVHYRLRIRKAESINFIDLLWQVFMTGLFVSVIQLSIALLFYILNGSKLFQNLLTVNFFYHINSALVTIFLVSTFIVWKRLILYQKSRQLLIFWQFFEYTLLAAILFNFFDYKIFDTVFNTVLIFLVLMGLVLSFNLKWIAYLNFRQKWQSILLLGLVILYLWFFFNNLLKFSQDYQLVNNLLSNIFVLSLFAFIFIYAIISLLVILFNLPTSSVFEQKMSEVINFQRLSQSINAGMNEDQIYDILLDSSINAVFANAAWLEIRNERGDQIRLLKEGIIENKITRIKEALEQNNLVNKLMNEEDLDNVNPNKTTISLKDNEYRSALIFPIVVKKRNIGTLFLLKDVADGFNKEMKDIIGSFVNQAVISLENFQFLAEELENERYQKELKVARKVQESLLPDELDHNESFDITAFSVAADEVGGDYYDTYRLDENRFALMIADVSGKGTSAAFHMSQMKGIFHSLAQLELGPDQFLIRANHALSRCLDKMSFITAYYFIIDTNTRQLSFARAGHCPAIYFCAESDSLQFFQHDGLGLGIAKRTQEFENHVFVKEQPFQKNDVLVLYTDGIVEARNGAGEEFGYDRLGELVKEYAALPAQRMQEAIIEGLYKFCGNELLNDDYTLVVVKFF